MESYGSALPLYAASEPQIGRLPGGAAIRLDLGEHVQRWIYFFGVYEQDTVDWFRSNLRPGMVVLDIGANVGQYTLIAARGVGPNGRVHAFEPNPISYRTLTSNIEINAFRNVSAHSLAVSDSAGEVTFYAPDNDNMGEASLQMSQTGQRNTTVMSVTIDDWAQSADLGPTPRIDIIKIDVQGLESAVLRGARQVMLRFRPVIICEFEERWLRDSGTSSVELKRMLRELSYSANRITSSGLSPVAAEEVQTALRTLCWSQRALEKRKLGTAQVSPDRHFQTRLSAPSGCCWPVSVFKIYQRIPGEIEWC